jgi:DNA-binding MurR/RpiR family transcriptional regulator
MNSLSQLIERKAGEFSASEERLARDLLEHPELWGFESSSQLAKRLEMHRSTIVRFAKRLGLGGFPALQRKVRAAYLKIHASSKDLTLTHSDITRDTLVHAIYERELRNLRETYDTLDLEGLEATAQGLAAARQVMVFGRRFSYPIALSMSMALWSMRDGVRLAPEPGGSSIHMLFDLGPEDYALVVSIRRHSTEVQRVLKYLAQAEVPHTLLTDSSPNNNVPSRARVLRAYVGSATILESYTALSSLSHALLALVGNLLPGGTSRLKRVEQAWQTFNEL